MNVRRRTRVAGGWRCAAWVAAGSAVLLAPVACGEEFSSGGGDGGAVTTSGGAPGGGGAAGAPTTGGQAPDAGDGGLPPCLTCNDWLEACQAGPGCPLMASLCEGESADLAEALRICLCSQCDDLCGKLCGATGVDQLGCPACVGDHMKTTCSTERDACLGDVGDG